MANSNKDFIGESLNDMLMIDSHISFCEAMLGKYALTSDAKNDIRETVAEIKEKRSDKKFNISVIGEFSTGKSTFINALIRKNLLSANSLQGTTIASTIIERAEENSVVVSYKDARRKTLYGDSDEKIRAVVDEYTSAAEDGQEIDSVKVNLDSKAMSGDFRIIDTPGTNVEQLWHEETTINAIKKFSDTSIVLFNATQQLPMSFLNFMHNHLEDVLAQCVFVVTKIDMVPPRERAGVLQYVEQRLKNDFDLKNPLVVPYASLFVLENADDTIEKLRYRYDDREELISLSYKSEVLIYNYVIRQRSVIQAKKILRLMDTMYTDVSGYMDSMKQSYKLDSERLERTKKAEIGVFIANQKQLRRRQFHNGVEVAKQEILQEISAKINECKTLIMNEFEACKTIDNVKSFTDTRYKQLCSEKTTACMNVADSSIYRIDDCFDAVMKTLKNEFERFYSKEGLSLDKLRQANVGDMTLVATGSLSGGTLGTVQSALSKENVAVFGSLGAGAVIGSLICPGIGTVIGAFLGMIFAPSPSVDDVKNKVRANIRSSLNDYFVGVENVIAANVDKYISDVDLRIINEADRYLQTYNSVISSEIEAQKRRKAKLDETVAAIDSDMRLIENRRYNLNKVSEKLNNIDFGVTM